MGKRKSTQLSLCTACQSRTHLRLGHEIRARITDLLRAARYILSLNKWPEVRALFKSFHMEAKTTYSAGSVAKARQAAS